MRSGSARETEAARQKERRERDDARTQRGNATVGLQTAVWLRGCYSYATRRCMCMQANARKRSVGAPAASLALTAESHLSG